MGGVRSTGMSIDCDRCKKLVPVADDKQADYYRDFAKREDQGSQMFQALLLEIDGDTSAYFEYLCPKCRDAVLTYMKKILMVKEDKPKPEVKPKPEAKAKPEVKPKPEPKPEAKAEPNVTITDETEPPPPDPDEPGLSFEEEEMFAGS